MFFTALGCAHEVESPAVAIENVEPNLVCSAQRVTNPAAVVIHGSGFTPMPTSVLALPSVLHLPSVELTGVADLSGSEIATPAVAEFSGDPDGALGSRLTWESRQQMTFRIAEPGPDAEDSLDLAPGLYDVTVTNPDKKRSATLERGLAVVPPPSITSVNPSAICTDQADQEVTLLGSNFLKLGDTLPTVQIALGATVETFTPDTIDGCAAVAGTYADSTVELCTSLTITVPQGTLSPGTYAITVLSPPPASCISSESITLTVTSPPEVDSVAPASVCEGGSTLHITGAGFRAGTTVVLRCPDDQTIAARAVDVLSDTELDAQIGSGIAVDELCEVIVTNPEGCEDRPEPHQTVRGTAGPFLFFADPFVVFNGVDTRVTLFSTTIEAPLPSMPVTLVPNGSSSGGQTFDATIVAQHPNRAQFTIPNGQAPGVYDVILADSTGCSAVLSAAVTVTDTTTIDLESVNPPFGAAGSRTAITVTRSGGMALTETPRLFLNASNGGSTAVAVERVTWTDGSTLTAVVPPGVPVGVYDLIVINPDGSVGVLDDAFEVLAEAPPVIRDVTPQSMTNNDTAVSFTISGSDFRAPQVTLECRAPGATNATTLTATDETAACDLSRANCSLSATVDASGLVRGSACVVRVTNDPGTDDSYGEFSAVGVTNSSLNLSSPVDGQPMTVGRRALVAAALKVTRAARFLYAIGGDGGSAAAATPFDSVEAAFVDVFGTMQPFRADAEPMTAARSFAAGTAVGRYLYVLGGSDGTDALASAERALVLIPEETPTLEDVDLLLGDEGLGAGQWSYRVSAVFGSNDPDNPDGESLPSDTFLIRLPAVDDRLISVVLSWSRPLDVLGVPLPNVASYRIYRTSVADETAGRDEVLLAEVDGATTTFTDDGSATPMPGVTPRPLGSTGTWHALPTLSTPRMGPATAVARDPGDTDESDGQDLLLYALLGKNGNSAHTSYEYLGITELPNGRHTLGTQWTVGNNSFGTGRWEIGAWTADAVVAPVLSPDTFVYVGGGRQSNGNLTGLVDAGRVTDGGELVITPVETFTPTRSGYGVAAANGQLFAFGGQGGSPSSGAGAAVITGAPTLANNAWNNEGLSLRQGRYLVGSAVQSAFIFLIGGQSGTTATPSTELVIW